MVKDSRKYKLRGCYVGAATTSSSDRRQSLSKRPPSKGARIAASIFEQKIRRAAEKCRAALLDWTSLQYIQSRRKLSFDLSAIHSVSSLDSYCIALFLVILSIVQARLALRPHHPSFSPSSSFCLHGYIYPSTPTRTQLTLRPRSGKRINTPANISIS